MISLPQKTLHSLKKEEQLDINMKVNQKQFELFKSECKKWIDIFELNNWEVAFKHNKSKNALAYCLTDVSCYKATIHLCKEWKKDEPIEFTNESIKKIALHEVLHLLLARLSDYGNSRFLSCAELGEAEEELVNKLINVFNK